MKNLLFCELLDYFSFVYDTTDLSFVAKKTLTAKIFMIRAFKMCSLKLVGKVSRISSRALRAEKFIHILCGFKMEWTWLPFLMTQGRLSRVSFFYDIAFQGYSLSCFSIARSLSSTIQAQKCLSLSKSRLLLQYEEDLNQLSAFWVSFHETCEICKKESTCCLSFGENP